MYWVDVNENSISITGDSVLVVGNANANRVIFSFSDEWDGLERVAVFHDSLNVVAVEIPTNSPIVYIPWECCEIVGDTVYLGAYGLDSDGNVKKPTTWVGVGTIVDGVSLDSSAHADPTKSIYGDLLEKVDTLSREVLGSDSNMDMINMAIENLENTSTDHREKIDALEETTEFYSHHPNLKDREEPNQHPISAIEGLSEMTVGDLSPDDLEELLGGDTP